MSLQDIRVRTETELNNIYEALEEEGATIPEQKNLVNVAPAIASIEGSVEPEQPQVHNYLMLYDGTLGEAGENGANVCADVTGGYIRPNSPSSYWVYSELIRNANSLSTSLTNNTSSTGKYSSLITSKLIDISDYTKIGCSFGLSHTTSVTNFWFNVRCLIKNSSQTYLTEISMSKQKTNENFNNNSGKYFNAANINELNLSTNEIYLEPNVNCEKNGTINVNFYALILFKEDDWQKLCEIVGLTASDYANESTLCSNSTAISTILNNKDAIDYMVHNCTGTFMLEFIQSETALNALNSSPYKVLVYQNDVWIKFLSMVA